MNLFAIIGIVVVITICEMLAFYTLEKYNETKSPFDIIVAIASYALIVLLLAKCFENESVSFVFIVWTVTSMMSIFIIGLYMKERIKFVDIIAFMFALIGLIVIYIGHRNDSNKKYGWIS